MVFFKLCFNLANPKNRCKNIYSKSILLKTEETNSR